MLGAAAGLPSFSRSPAEIPAIRKYRPVTCANYTARYKKWLSAAFSYAPCTRVCKHFITGKSALITGGFRNIGAGTARSRAAQDATVALTYWSSPEAGESIVADVTAARGKAVDLRALHRGRPRAGGQDEPFLPDRRRNPCPTADAIQ